MAKRKEAMTALDDIGFYTLSEERAHLTSSSSPLMRCELLVTDRCNFNCPYCRSAKNKKDLSRADAFSTVGHWIKSGLVNLRISGGEPTLWPYLVDLVTYARRAGVERIAISTNGSADTSLYTELLKAGVDDFSISLDGGCCAVGDAMAGGIEGAWDKVVENIKYVSSKTYCTVGIVFTEDNVDECVGVVEFAASLGVSDIRIISSAQYNRALIGLKKLPSRIVDQFPILNYRIGNMRQGRDVRGMSQSDFKHCYLALDDMAVSGNKHYPCIIHLREGGEAIGDVGPNMRQEREQWVYNHDCFQDPICRQNCLDICVQYNNACGGYSRDSE